MKGIVLTPDVRLNHNLPVYNCPLQLRNLYLSASVLIEKRLLPLFTLETLTESNITYIWCILLCISRLISVAMEPVQITGYLSVFAVPCWARHLWQSSTKHDMYYSYLGHSLCLSVIASHLKTFPQPLPCQLRNIMKLKDILFMVYNLKVELTNSPKKQNIMFTQYAFLQIYVKYNTL